jgi:hypothetical protein
VKVVVSFQEKYSAITVIEDAVVAYERYIGQGAELTLEEYLETREQDRKIE